jgi:FkbM family methyltransferase
LTGYFERALQVSPRLRRLAWRSGRKLYSCARGEPSRNNIRVNGEAYVQACVVRALLPEHSLCIADIGANQGDWTLSLLHAMADYKATRNPHRIHLFEPVPATVERLRASLATADAKDWTAVHPLAVSDLPGTAPMGVMSATGGTNTLHAGHATGASVGAWIGVEKITLADFWAQQGIVRMHLVKSDTEGHDMCVLRGAKDLLSAGRIDVFQFEYNHRWVFSRYYLKDVFDLVAGLPYRVARIMPSHLEILPSWHPELERFFEANYLLIKNDALGWFDTRCARFDASNTITAA